jgi:hypothetical protein
MRTLLWIFLVLVEWDLWAASASDAEACMRAAGRPARAAAPSATDERPDSPDDYKFSTLADAVEFCSNVVEDNLLGLRELKKYWSSQLKLEPDDSVTSICFREFLTLSETDQQEWHKFSIYLHNVLTNERVLPDLLNQLIQLKRALDLEVSRAEEIISRDLDSVFCAKKRNNEAKKQSFDDFLSILIPFSSEKYQSYYRGIGYELRSLIDMGEPYAKEVVGEFFEIGNLLGEVVRLPLGCDIELGIEGDPTLYGGVQTSTIRVLTPNIPGFFMPIHRLPSDKVKKYTGAYDAAKKELEAKIARRQRMSGKAKKTIAPTHTVTKDTRSLDDLLAALGEPSGSRNKNVGGKKAGTSAAREGTRLAAEAAAREKAERETAAALEAARAAEIAAAREAAREQERVFLRERTLALVGAQKPILSLEHALGASATATLSRTYLGSQELNPVNRDMLLNLMRYDGLEHAAVSVRSYNWDQLKNLLDNLGFKRRGKNFVGSDAAGKRKQIGLHYLHNKGESLNPDLVQIMFKQLHASVGWGRAALGRLAGITEKLHPWSWESEFPR